MKYSILLLILFASAGLRAQNIRFEGFVKDTLGQPLEMANVLAVNNNTDETEAYSITSEEGKFSLVLKNNTTYRIQVSYIGFQPREFELTTAGKNIVREIKLREGTLLQGLEIVHEIPVKINGDTLTYNTGAFTNGTERKLGDILKKLPGIEVTPDGEILAQGKQVSRLMVEGNAFFDGDTKIGSKNIPADAVDKIEVLSNYNPVSQLKNVEDNQDNVAMNIKLKEGKKNFWFGDLTAAAGPYKRYVLNPSLFYYSPEYSLNYIGNQNNTGAIPFTFQDYFKLSGGLKDIMRKGQSNFAVIPPELEALFIQNNKAKEIYSRFNAANFSFNPGSKWRFSGFGILSSNTIDSENATVNALLDNRTGEVNTRQYESTTAHSSNIMALFKVNANYRPHERLEVNYDLFAKGSRLKSRSHSNTVVYPENDQSQEASDRTKRKPFSVSQNLDLYHTLKNKKNVFALNLQHRYQDEDPFYNAIQEQTPFVFTDYQQGQEKNNLSQEKFVKTSKLDAKLDFYHRINGLNQLNLTLAATHAYQNLDSHIFQLLDNGLRNPIHDASANNNADYTFNDAFAALHYKLTAGRFTFNPGVALHSYHTKSNQPGKRYRNNFSRLLPDASIDFKAGKNSSLRYSFNLSNNFTDIKELAEGSILHNYYTLYKGDPGLDNSVLQNHMLYYHDFNAFYMSTTNAFLRYSKTRKSINNRADFNGVNSIQTPFNSDYANERLSATLRYGRSVFRNYKINLGVSLKWEKSYTMQKNTASGQWAEAPQESYSQNYNAAITTVFDNLPSLTLGYSLFLNNYPDATYLTHKPTATLEYYFLNGFSLTSNYQFYNYSNTSGTIKNQYDFLDLSLSYQKPESPLEYRINATNLLNTKTINSDQFSEFISSTSTYTVQTR